MAKGPTQAAAVRRPGPTYPTGAALALLVARLIGADLWYSARRLSYRHFRLRALRRLPDRNLRRTWRLTRLGRHIVLTGGEPMLRYDCLLEILQAHDGRLTDLHLHTSGAGVTSSRARELAAWRERTGRAVARYEEFLPQWDRCLTREGRP